MATEDQQQKPMSPLARLAAAARAQTPISDELEALASPADLRDRVLGDLDVATNRSTSSVIASAGELASLAAAAASLDAIASRAPVPVQLAGGPELDVDQLTHELWNGIQELGTRGYATIVSDDAVDVLHACLARQGFGLSTAIG